MSCLVCLTLLEIDYIFISIVMHGNMAEENDFFFILLPTAEVLSKSEFQIISLFKHFRRGWVESPVEVQHEMLLRTHKACCQEGRKRER